MNDLTPNFNEDSPVEKAAAEWTLRLDRGLTPQEQDDYTEWLARHPSHREAMALCEWGWSEFDRLAGLHNTHHARVDPDLLAPESASAPKAHAKRRLTRWFAALPFAAAVAVAMYISWPEPASSGLEVKPALELMARIEQRMLDDGSRVDINRGADLEVAYSSERRLVYLRKGEANFEVAKDPARPFVVNVAGVDVQAVGTVFSVKLLRDEVNVVVTEGKVNIKPIGLPQDSIQGVGNAFLEMGQRAKVDLSDAFLSVEVTPMDDSEIADATRWRPRLLDFESAPLSAIVDEFNRSNPIQVVLGDPELETMRLSSSFWSDNVEGFVRLMESSFGMKAEWQGSREIVLREAN